MHLVWILSERCWGTIISMLSEHSLVQYDWNGTLIEEWHENDDLIDIAELGIEYETDIQEEPN